MKRLIIATSVILFSAAGLVLVGQAPTLPGTSVDRIGFPKDYQTTFKQLYVCDNDANRQIDRIESERSELVSQLSVLQDSINGLPDHLRNNEITNPNPVAESLRQRIAKQTRSPHQRHAIA